MNALLHVILLASLACLCQGQVRFATGSEGQGSFATGSEGCSDMYDPFGDKNHYGVASIDDCKQMCLGESTFRCQSVLYSMKKKECVLSANFRTESLLPLIWSDFQYLERPQGCGEIDLDSRITSCQASSEYNYVYECQYAYDGSDLPGDRHEWATLPGQGLGAYIIIHLDRSYMLTAIRIKHRCDKKAQVSAWKIEMDNRAEIQATRSCGGTNSWYGCTGEGNDWFEVELPLNTHSSYVKLTMTGVCNPAGEPGIRELEIIGYPE